MIYDRTCMFMRCQFVMFFGYSPYTWVLKELRESGSRLHSSWNEHEISVFSVLLFIGCTPSVDRFKRFNRARSDCSKTVKTLHLEEVSARRLIRVLCPRRSYPTMCMSNCLLYAIRPSPCVCSSTLSWKFWRETNTSQLGINFSSKIVTENIRRETGRIESIITKWKIAACCPESSLPIDYSQLSSHFLTARVDGCWSRRKFRFEMFANHSMEKLNWTYLLYCVCYFSRSYFLGGSAWKALHDHVPLIASVREAWTRDVTLKNKNLAQ